MKCPTCGLETSEFRCPRCNALLLGACSGSCSSCAVTCDVKGAPEGHCAPAAPGGALEKARRLWRQALRRS